ncbi:MAG: PAS domain-containing sensor histidine kinase [Pirellulaceae bacterium]
MASRLLGFLAREGPLMADPHESQEEAFRTSSEERYRSLVVACPDAVVMSDLQGQILFASPQTLKLFGLPEDYDLRGKRVLDYIIEADQARLTANIVTLVATGERLNTEYTALRADGTTVSLEVSTAVVREAVDRPPAVMAVIRDVTERKRAQETLQQSLDQLQTIYNEMIEGLVITDLESKRFVRVNSSLCRMLGYSEEELLSLALQDIHPPEAIPDDLRRFQAAAEGRVTINEDRPVLRKDGSILYADITGHRIVYNGRSCLLALFRDVTERKQTQEALGRERVTLLHMLRASDCDRQSIAYEIHDGLAQDLAAAIMQFQAYEHFKEQNRATAKEAFDAGKQLLRQAYTEARRLISGVRPPILDESGLVAALEHLIHDQGVHGGPIIEFQSEVKSERLPLILENTIYRMAQEALTNACRHSRSHKIRVSLMQDEHQICLEVEDWGIGFHPAVVPEDRFGLEGIRERARLLGGQVTIQSQPEKGSLVRVTLPLLKAEPRPQT